MIKNTLCQVGDTVTAIDTQQIAELRDLLVGFTERVAGTSRGSLLLVYLITLMNVSALVVFLWYFVVYQGHSLLWLPAPFVVLAVPTAVVWVYQRILHAVVTLPNQIAQTADDTIASIADYREELVELSGEGLTLFKRWKAYLFLGKLLWKMKSVSDEGMGILGAFGLVALMINPLFWGVLIISIALSLLVSGGLILFCLLHAWLT